MVESFEKRNGFIWMNGKFLPWTESKIHVLTHGLHYASCVFEGERAYRGRIFKLREHTERLFFSAGELGFEIPYSMEDIDRICEEILKKNNLSDAYIRPIAWRGSEMMGVSAQKNRINVAVAAWEWPSYFKPDEKLKGIRMSVAQYRRPSPETAPCHAKAAGLYMICTLSKHQAEQQGYADAMMLDYRGHVAEATGANLFFIKNNEIYTPMPDCFLDGITSQTVIALARQEGIKVTKCTILPEELDKFSECFITGTATEVTAVSQIGSYHFTPSDITKTLIEKYTNVVHSNI